MHDVILTLILAIVCLLGLSLGLWWQLMRRRPKKRRIDRFRACEPKSTPTMKEDAPFDETKFHSVSRPKLFAISPERDDAMAAEVFVQRAYAIDEAHFRALPIERIELKEIDCLFEHASALSWEPESDFSKDIYEFSFSPMITRALEAGFHPRTNATAADLSVISYGYGAYEMGESMSMPDYSWGSPARVELLWSMANPAEQIHELEPLLNKEIEIVRSSLDDVLSGVSSVRALVWKNRWDQLFDLVRDAERLGAAPGQAQERTLRADDLAAQMRSVNAEIDHALKGFTKSISGEEELDLVLPGLETFLKERELSILMLRAIALIRVMVGDDYTHGMRCSNKIKENVLAFPRVDALVNALKGILDGLDVSSLKEEEKEGRLEAIEQKRKTLDDVIALDESIYQRLEKDVHTLQNELDKYLIVQGHVRRLAVRLNSDNKVSEMLILER